jgi:hypothetical protein
VVWQRVRNFAAEAAKRRLKIYTLQRKVPNVITDVKEGSVGRESAEGRTNASRVTRGMVARTWDAMRKGQDPREVRDVLYFTPALMLRTLPDLLEYVGDGRIALRGDPGIAKRNQQRIQRAQQEDRGWAGGEGQLHHAIKTFIDQEPDKALAALGPGPYTRVGAEHVLPTGDRIDVVLLDRDGNVVLVEVKPLVMPDDLAPWAQAAKYRTLWSILEDRPLPEIRCVVAAPEIPDRWAEAILKKHGIESVAINNLPRNYYSTLPPNPRSLIPG